MILIAGGTGRLGRLLVQALADDHPPLRVLTRQPDAAADLSERGIQAVLGDVRDPQRIREAVTGCTTVVSVLSGFGPMGSSSPESVDRDGNIALIRAARDSGVRRFVLVSMHGAAAVSPLPLLRMKHAAEQELQNSGLRWTIVRPTAFLETYLETLGAPLRRRASTLVFGSGRIPVNFVSVHDVAALVQRVTTEAGWDGKTIEIGGEDLTLDELSAALHAAAGTPGRARHIPLAALRVMSVAARPFSPFLARAARAAVVLNTTNSTFDSAPARRAIPGLPFTSLADAARDSLHPSHA